MRTGVDCPQAHGRTPGALRVPQCGSSPDRPRRRPRIAEDSLDSPTHGAGLRMTLSLAGRRGGNNREDRRRPVDDRSPRAFRSVGGSLWARPRATTSRHERKLLSTAVSRTIRTVELRRFISNSPTGNLSPRCAAPRPGGWSSAWDRPLPPPARSGLPQSQKDSRTQAQFAHIGSSIKRPYFFIFL
jgi:hypothetical protein